MSATFKLFTVNLCIVAAIIVGYFYGYIAPIFANDVSHISYIISFLIGINIILAHVDSWRDEHNGYSDSEIKRWLNYISVKFIYIGLIGTLVGFSHLMGGINQSSDVSQVIDTIKTGCTTLANTSLLGVLGYIWVSFNFYLVGEE